MEFRRSFGARRVRACGEIQEVGNDATKASKANSSICSLVILFRHEEVHGAAQRTWRRSLETLNHADSFTRSGRWLQKSLRLGSVDSANLTRSSARTGMVFNHIRFIEHYLYYQLAVRQHFKLSRARDAFGEAVCRAKSHDEKA